jgi:hypothetical protein
MSAKGAMAKFEPEKILENTFELEFGREKFILKKTGQRIDISYPGSPEPFALIRMGSPSSGSIWLGSECIAEFERQKDEYVVTPIYESRKKPDEVVEIDPFTFVFQRAKSSERHKS